MVSGTNEGEASQATALKLYLDFNVQRYSQPALHMGL